MQYRKNEDAKSWFRSDRFFIINSQWYFNTREGQNVGPFESIEHAQKSVPLFLDTLQNTKNGRDFAQSIAINGQWALTNYS